MTISKDEQARLDALAGYGILDTAPEVQFDRLTRIAAHLFEAPIALMSLVDKDRQWFKSACGLVGDETPREWAFCDRAIAGRKIFIVPDARLDRRFKENPLVTGDPHIRFYAGAPLITSDGFALGTVCVIDNKPRPGMSIQHKDILQDIADSAVDLIEFRKLRAQS